MLMYKKIVLNSWVFAYDYLKDECTNCLSVSVCPSFSSVLLLFFLVALHHTSHVDILKTSPTATAVVIANKLLVN